MRYHGGSRVTWSKRSLVPPGKFQGEGVRVVLIFKMSPTYGGAYFSANKPSTLPLPPAATYPGCRFSMRK